MGVVWESLDRERDEHVALKTIRQPVPDWVSAIKTEFRALHDLRHENLVRLHELHEHEGTWFFTMEVIRGVGLLEWVRPGDGFDEARVRDAIKQLARGVHALHRSGRVHRDIKASNVRVTPAGRVVLFDFGLVIGGDDSPAAEAGRLKGTPSHVAPEQVMGSPATAASDWYAVGVVLYACLVGATPFAGAVEAQLSRKVLEEPIPPGRRAAGVPSDLDALAMALLARDPAVRPTGVELLRRLGDDPPDDDSFEEFLGRDRELGMLETAFGDAAARQVTVLVHGPSGVGKSALVRQLRTVAASRGALVLPSRCYERETAPFKAVDGMVEALSEHLEALAERRPTPPPPGGVLLARLFPAMRRVPGFEGDGSGTHPPSDAAGSPSDAHEAPTPEARRRAFGALRDLLRGLEGPVVVPIDDLQWADDDSLVLLGEILRGPDAPRLLLVATVRTRGGERESPRPESGTSSLDRLASRLPGDVRRLELGGLPPEDATLLARRWAARLGSRVSPERVADEAAGHPLFIEMLLRGGEGRLDEAIGARLHRLPAPCRAVVDALAVAGAPLPAAVVASALGCGFAELEDRLAELGAERLVRTSGPGPHRTVECYHDRVHEAALALLSPEERRPWHERLVLAIERHHGDAEALSEHHEAIGDRERACELALVAARRAREVFAFDRAARLFTRAVELGAPASAHVARAEALADAGRGPQAAEAFLAAAEVNPAAALDLRRRAAEQLLRSGRIDEGIALVAEVLRAVGLSFPSSPWLAILAFLAQRARIAWRGFEFREQDAREVRPDALTRIDMCWTAGACLGLVDPIRGRTVDAVGLRLALDAGEPHRVARALAMEACYSAVEGSASAVATASKVERAARLLQRLGNTYALGWEATARGVTACLEGRFQEGYRHCTRADALWSRCTGVAWERATTQWFGTWASTYVGELAYLSSVIPELVADAQARGDLYAEVTACTGLSSLAYLAADRPDEARERIDHAMASWSRSGFHVEHWWATQARGHHALYQGDGEAAYQDVSRSWAGLRSSLLLRVEPTRLEATHLRARAALAAGDLAGCERDIARLRREGAGWIPPLVALLEAGLAATRGDRDGAARHLETGLRLCEADGNRLFAAAARHRLGDRGALAALGVEAPDRMVRALVPGGFDAVGVAS